MRECIRCGSSMKENCAIKVEGAGYGVVLSSDENKLFGGRMGQTLAKFGGSYMGKPLSDMALEELWELFPIILTEHKEIWNSWYADEHRRLAAALLSENIRISHIGSTAICGIWAKPIIDILVELPMALSMESVKDILVQNGYICMSEQPDRKSFNRGYTSEGFAEKVFHLHLRYWGDNDELYFRDYLNENLILAKQYEKLKLSLWKKFEHDRDGYTLAKTSFVDEQTDKAKHHYGVRYD